jgi:hypothetical protein
MRVHVSGPSLGFVHTTLWSSGHRKNGKGGVAGLWLFTILAAWGFSPAAGIVATAILAVIITVAVRVRRQARKVSAS